MFHRFREDPRRIYVVYHNDLYNVLGSVAYYLSHNVDHGGLYGDVKYLSRKERVSDAFYTFDDTATKYLFLFYFYENCLSITRGSVDHR